MVRKDQSAWVAKVVATVLVGCAAMTAVGFVQGAVAAGPGGNGATEAPASTGTLRTDARYEIVAKNSGKALDVLNRWTADGAPISQWRRNHGTNQQWTFAPVAGGYYRVLSVHTGKALAIANSATAIGAQAVQTAKANAAGQQWKLTDAGDGTVRFTNRGSGLALDVNRLETTDGARVQQWPANAGANQKFTLLRVPAVPTAPAAVAPAGFVHPGVGFTKTDLAWLKSHLTEEPYKTTYANLAKDGHSSLDYVMRGPFDTVSRTPDIHLGQYRSDMQALYDLSLMGYLSGDARYSDKARQILLAWAKTQKSFTGGESYLTVGDFISRTIGGAEILRGTYSGWSDADTAVVKAFFSKVYWGDWYIGYRDRGAGTQVRSANQGADQLAPAMAIAVYLDDRTKFDMVVNAYLTDPAGGIRNSLPNGQLGDTGRDQGHAYGQLIHLAFVAEVAWKQGVDLFSAENNRLLAASEYYARFNLGEPVPFVQSGTSYGVYSQVGGSPRVPTYNDGLDVVHTAYAVRKKIPTPYTDQLLAKMPQGPQSIVFRRDVDTSTAVAPAGVWSAGSGSPVTSAHDLISADIGDVHNLTGSTIYNNGTWKLTGSGADQEHGFRFAYRPLRGDSTITAHVTNRGGPTAVSGLLVRSTLDTQRNGYVVSRLFGSGGEQVFWRQGTGILAGSGQSHPIVNGPYWLRLVRRGNFIYSYNSIDGQNWSVSANTVFAALPETLYVGLFTSSGTATQHTAVFDHVSIGTTASTLAAAPTNPRAISANGKVTLRWTAAGKAVTYSVARSATAGGPYTPIANQVDRVWFTDGSVTAGQTYFYTITSNSFGGASPRSVEVSATP